jgi:hypothetical protein
MVQKIVSTPETSLDFRMAIIARTHPFSRTFRKRHYMGNPPEIKPKDLFSRQASLYATFRPTYPEALYQFIFQHVPKKETAWDCATGNGQVAQYLSRHFRNVFATDISQQQLDNALQLKNVAYSIAPAEQTSFANGQFDLITVGQALHWFDHEAFYKEVNRVSNTHGIIAVWGYNILSVAPDIDNLLNNFYHNVVGPYWDDARKMVENAYRSIPFPFKEIPTPSFYITLSWTPEQLEGYLLTWSSTQKYIKTTNANPIPFLMEKIHREWHPGKSREIRFPVFLRIGMVNRSGIGH